jgi:rubrerythrin
MKGLYQFLKFGVIDYCRIIGKEVIRFMQPAYSGIRPPTPGDKAFFVCKKCGHRFMATLPVLPIPVQCPECGSLNTAKDTIVKY